MSRYLSEALGADEQSFRQDLIALEGKSGHLNHDIRLTARLYERLTAKIRQLGLDPIDTTPEELYYALGHKLAEEDKQLVRKTRELAAREVNAEASVSDGLERIVKNLSLDKSCFALKASVLKKQLQNSPPKKAMKTLGYRSIDSMLRSVAMPLVMLAINYYESEAYVSHFYASYRKLTASSFEMRPLSILIAKDPKWQKVLSEVHKKTGLTLVSSYELAAIVVLPVKNEPPSGYLTALIAAIVSEASLIYSASSYLKLYQVSRDFGLKLTQIAEHEPFLESSLLERPASWEAAQNILKDTDHELYAPHLSAEDLEQENILEKLGNVLEEFKFWSDSQILGLVRSGQATSLNLLDVAQSVLGRLPFERRPLENFRRALSSELAKLYLMPEQIVEELAGSSRRTAKMAMAEEQAEAVY